MSRSAKVILPVFADRFTPAPAELVTFVLPKLATTAELAIERPMAVLFCSDVVPDVNEPLPPLNSKPFTPPFEETVVNVIPSAVPVSDAAPPPAPF